MDILNKMSKSRRRALKQEREWGREILLESLVISETHYLDVLKHIHDNLAYTSYFEIGSRRGNSLALAKGFSVGVDPVFNVQDIDIIQDKDALLVFQKTSDDFFADDAPTVFGNRTIDLAFIDGLHYCEQSLKDVLNAEAYCGPNSVMVVHDIIPSTLEMAERERCTKKWAGDVWIAADYLLQARPDLRLGFVDAFPTGLLMITGFGDQDRTRAVLPEAFAAFAQERHEQPRKLLKKYLGALDILPAEQVLAGEVNSLDRLIANSETRKLKVK